MTDSAAVPQAVTTMGFSPLDGLTVGTCGSRIDAAAVQHLVEREDWVRLPLCAELDGFSPHSAVRVEGRDRKRPTQLCR